MIMSIDQSFSTDVLGSVITFQCMSLCFAQCKNLCNLEIVLHNLAKLSQEHKCSIFVQLLTSSEPFSEFTLASNPLFKHCPDYCS